MIARCILIVAIFTIGYASSVCADINDEYEIKSKKAEQHAQKIIQECKKSSQEDWNSGVNGRMMQGSYNYTECLKKNIVHLADLYFKNEQDKDDFIKSLDVYDTTSNDLYWLLYNTHKGCSPCGTMYQGMHLNQTASSLEDILTLILSNSYEFDIYIDR